MAIKSAWAYRNGLRMMRESIDFNNKIEAEKKKKHIAALPDILKKRKKAREIKKKINEAAFQELEVGDNLSFFGLPHIIVEKKNKKSIITSRRM